MKKSNEIFSIKNKTFIITGSSGQLGTFISNFLKENGALVIGIDSVKKNSVDFEQIPVPHFGVVLSMDAWNNLSKSLLEKKISFIIKPTVRFKGTVGEQATMFFEDPSGNALEFKAFNNIKKQLFAI